MHRKSWRRQRFLVVGHFLSIGGANIVHIKRFRKEIGMCCITTKREASLEKHLIVNYMILTTNILYLVSNQKDTIKLSNSGII